MGVWAGFVFINFDLDCEPLESYLECLPEHFKAFNTENRYKAIHGGKVLPCNWKLAQEAFMEGYHIAMTHPQSVEYTADTNTQYDVFDGRHVSPLRHARGGVQPRAGQLPPAEDRGRDAPGHGLLQPCGHHGRRGRDGARTHRRPLRGRGSPRPRGRDFSNQSTSESIDLIQYFPVSQHGPLGRHVHAIGLPLPAPR